MKNNIILNSDSYKQSHYLQYPPGAAYVHSYIESRGGKYTDVMLFGLQAFIKEYLLQPITQSDIDEAKALMNAHGVPFNESGWQYILDEHKGYLPVIICALPEGYICTNGEPLVVIENTDPECYWLTSFLETALLRAIWYPTTVASVSFAVKKTLMKFARKTADNQDFVQMQLHDFGSRGVSSRESAGLGGLAHLMNFCGTDTIDALRYGREYYNIDCAGLSVPAAEHSTVTSWGRDNESKMYEHMIDTFGKDGAIYSIVVDSYDVYNATSNIIGDELADKVRNQNARLVVRPDSGDPETMPIDIIERLIEQFGCTFNKKGYQVLPDYVRVLQGDGIDPESIETICMNLASEKISTENIVFGMGGGLLQDLNRDTLKFAMKASYIEFDDQTSRDVYKDPITDPGKISKKGRQYTGEMRCVYVNGQLLIDRNFDSIKRR